MEKIRVAVFGSTGHLGTELIEILSGREDVDIAYKASRYFGKKEEINKIKGAQVQVAFCPWPHKESMKLVPEILELVEVGVIDLSGAYRLKDPSAYQGWYGWKHSYPFLLERAVYGLPEENRERIKTATLIANPGCYPTAIILGLKPLRAVITSSKIRVRAISGYTGAGRETKIPKTLTPYNAGRQHQHIPEVEQELDIPNQLWFFPEIAPFPRGILTTVYLPYLPTELSEKELQSLYSGFYREEPFVRIKSQIGLDDVIKTNFCDIMCQVIKFRGKSWAKITVAIDNLLKGGSGQAVQNLNIMFGLPETEGLL